MSLEVRTISSASLFPARGILKLILVGCATGGHCVCTLHDGWWPSSLWRFATLTLPLPYRTACNTFPSFGFTTRRWGFVCNSIRVRSRRNLTKGFRLLMPFSVPTHLLWWAKLLGPLCGVHWTTPSDVKRRAEKTDHWEFKTSERASERESEKRKCVRLWRLKRQRARDTQPVSFVLLLSAKLPTTSQQT